MRPLPFHTDDATEDGVGVKDPERGDKDKLGVGDAVGEGELSGA